MKNWWKQFKEGFVVWTFFFVLVVACFVFVAIIASTDFEIGDIMTVLGVWLMAGILLGDRKRRGTTFIQYLAGQGMSIGIFSILLFVISLIALARDDSQLTVVGFIMLALVGIGFGFLAGQDKAGKDKLSDETVPDEC